MQKYTHDVSAKEKLKHFYPSTAINLIKGFIPLVFNKPYSLPFEGSTIVYVKTTTTELGGSKMMFSVEKKV